MDGFTLTWAFWYMLQNSILSTRLNVRDPASFVRTVSRSRILSPLLATTSLIWPCSVEMTSISPATGRLGVGVGVTVGFGVGVTLGVAFFVAVDGGAGVSFPAWSDALGTDPPPHATMMDARTNGTSTAGAGLNGFLPFMTPPPRAA